MAAVQNQRAGTLAPQGGIVYRACSALEDLRQCVRLQKDIWGFDDIEVLPSDTIVAVLESGGQIFGAFDESEAGREAKMVGFLVAMPGIRKDLPFLHSHMLGVLPGYQNRGVGRRLKLMQRDDALARGIALVEWTFDPLEPRNAFFNFVRLGAIARRYVPNRYGITSSGLHAGLPTDRLVAEWWVSSERVRATLEGRPSATPVVKRIEIPADIDEIKKRDRDRALEVQTRICRQFQEAFAAGLAAFGFDRKGAYLLGREEQFKVPSSKFEVEDS